MIAPDHNEDPPPLVVALDDENVSPTGAGGAFVAPGAVLVGDVRLAPGVSVWYGAVVRADTEYIEIGRDSNIQDGCTLHGDPGYPVVLGDRVSLGHRAVVHGARVEADCLIGMGAIVLNGARIGSGSLVAAGAVVRPGTEIPPGSLVAGVPAEVRRDVSDEERATIADAAASYTRRADRYRRHARPVVLTPSGDAS